MRLIWATAVVGLSLFISQAWSAESKTAAKAESTDHNFEDVLVQGKYFFSDEAVTTVEEDKVLDSLIGVRTDFKDRLQQSAERF